MNDHWTLDCIWILKEKKQHKNAEDKDLIHGDDNHGVFREEWCGRGKTIISRYLRSDSGKNKVSEQSTQIDKKCKDFI